MSAYPRENSPYWWVQGRVNGERYRKPTPYLVKGKAKSAPPEVGVWEEALRERILLKQSSKGAAPIGGELLQPTLEVMEHFFFLEKEQKSHLHPDTLKAYRHNWAHLRRYFKHADECCTRLQLRAYVSDRYKDWIPTRKRYPSTKTIKKEITVLLNAWDEAVEHGVPMPPKPKRPDNFRENESKDEKKSGKYREPKVIRRFLKILKTSAQKAGLPDRGIRAERAWEAYDRALLTILTGMRWWEVNKLGLVKKFSDKNPTESATIFAYLPPEVTKKKKGRWVPLSPMAYKAWKRSVPFTSKHNKKKYEAVSQAMGLADHLTLRDLRTSFATGTVDAGATQAAVDGVMGHRKAQRDDYQKVHKGRLEQVARYSLVHLWMGSAKGMDTLWTHSPKIVPIRGKRKVARNG